jgi:hypothetical protein
MDLRIEADALARFFDMTPKVIVAAGDALADTLADDADDSAFEVWVFTPAGPAPAVIRPRADAGEPAGRLVAVPNLPAATCVLAARTAEGCAALEPLRAWWADNGPRPVSLLRCRDGAGAEADLLGLFLRAARQELHDVTAQATSAAAQIYELRCEYEQTRLAAEALRQEMIRLRRWPRLTRVNLAPDGRVYAPPGGRGGIAQPLPVSADGLAGIDLHFPPCGPVAPNAQVLVRLHAIDMGRDLGVWRLSARHLGKGWVRCWLPDVLAVTSHYVELRVEWPPSGAAAPPIALAALGDWDELRARPQGSPLILDGCLALNAWAGGVPGAPLKDGPLWCSPNADGSVEYSLCPDEITSMRLRVPTAWQTAPWYPFQMRPDGSFMLQPVGSLATSLLLPDGCGPDVERVTAVVKITNPAAPGDVLYAVAAADIEQADSLLDQPDPASDPHFVAFSGWHMIPRDDAAHVIVLDLPKGRDGPAHLILATRMLPNVDHTGAWADWLDVRLRLRGPQAPVVEPAEAAERRSAA